MENKNLINNAILFIQNNATANLSLQSIAENAGFSLNYFDTIFKKHTGYTPIEYARVYKLTRSALFLRKTDRSVLDIALEFGYQNPESYSRAFKSFYNVTPSEYRRNYMNTPLSIHDYSGKIAVSSFKCSYPELHTADMEAALDSLFVHNPVLYSETIVGITTADVAVMTLGDTNTLEHFIYASDYGTPHAYVEIVCYNESDALMYLDLLLRNNQNNFTIRTSPNEEWNRFSQKALACGYTYSESFDMIYLKNDILVPSLPDVVIRELFAEDMSVVRAFGQRGGCQDCHVRGLQAHFDQKGNAGERAFGLFYKGELICLTTPVCDTVRDMQKYDIGALFAIDKGTAPQMTEALWKHVINECIRSGAIIGNAGAVAEDGLLDIAASERIGMQKIAKCTRYIKA